jgi:soluble lytic murein transglycosylase-like protein
MRRAGVSTLSILVVLLAASPAAAFAAPFEALGFEAPLDVGALLRTWHRRARGGAAGPVTAESVKAPRIRHISGPTGMQLSAWTLTPVSGAMRQRRDRYAALIDREAARHGVAPALVHAVIRAESGYAPRARSAAGACGLMQLMPATARRFGVRDIWDPAENIRGGVAYLRVLLERFDGDLRLVLAAYNAGEGAVAKYGNRIPPYRETRSYVRRVLGYLGAA